MSKEFYIGDFTITVREIIVSISIIAIMLLFGFLIGNKISENQMDKNEMYNKAVKIENKDLFQYGMDTNIGNAFVYGKLKAVDTVTYPEIKGQYMSVKKVLEKYTKHTRVVTKRRTVNGKTRTYTETETYWTWDAIDREAKHCKKVTFLGIEFDYGQIYKPGERHIDTQSAGYHLRNVYYGSGTEYTGTIFTKLKDNTVNDVHFYNGMNIEETVKTLESSVWLVVFWIFWIFLIIGLVVGFYYLENKWLK